MGAGMRKALLVAAVALSTVGVVAAALWGGLEGGDRLWPVTWVVWAPVGALILWKRPGNGVGATMLGIGLTWGICFLCLAFAHVSSGPLVIRVWVELVNVLLGVIPWLGIIWLLLIYPSGRLKGRLERVTAVALGVLGAVALFAFLVSSEPMETTGMPSPLATDWLSGVVLWFVTGGFVLVLGVTLVAMISLGRRWRASDGVERHQYRWLLLGAMVFVGILAMGNFLPEDNAAIYLWVVGGVAIPVSVGIAVTRYRLFEIDRIISRTVTYALVVGFLGLAVAGVAAIAGSQFETPWVVAATTLGLAALFNPVRRRVQVWVDRRFNRSKYDAERVVSEFAGSLHDRVDAEDVVQGWLGVVDSTLQPASVGVWVRQ